MRRKERRDLVNWQDDEKDLFGSSGDEDSDDEAAPEAAPGWSDDESKTKSQQRGEAQIDGVEGDAVDSDDPDIVLKQ